MKNTPRFSPEVRNVLVMRDFDRFITFSNKRLRINFINDRQSVQENFEICSSHNLFHRYYRAMVLILVHLDIITISWGKFFGY